MTHQSIRSSAGGWLATYSLPRTEIIFFAVTCNYHFQQIRVSDIWRESEHEDLQHRLLDYRVKITMIGTRFDPPTIKFEGSTDDSMMDIHPRINYRGMKRRDTVIGCCGRYNVTEQEHISCRRQRRSV